VLEKALQGQCPGDSKREKEECKVKEKEGGNNDQ